MVIVMSTGATRADVQQVLDRLVEQGCRGELTVGVERTIITVVGSISPALQEDVRVLPQVDRVVPIGKPYRLASRLSNPAGTVVQVGPVAFGDGGIAVLAGPGVVESAEQMAAVTALLKREGGALLWGGALRSGHSPYAFGGLGAEGLQHLAAARNASGLPVVREVATAGEIALVAGEVDLLEIGASNMRNYGLLESAARSGKPILLHREISATIDEWLLSAEHILAAGNRQVVLCESGIRSYDPATALVADLSAVPILKKLTHLPVVVDPSHGAGRADLVTPLALAALAAGADGLAVQVHPHPEHALADGPQSMNPEQYGALMARLGTLAAALGRVVT